MSFMTQIWSYEIRCLINGDAGSIACFRLLNVPMDTTNSSSVIMNTHGNDSRGVGDGNAVSGGTYFQKTIKRMVLEQRKALIELKSAIKFVDVDLQAMAKKLKNTHYNSAEEFALKPKFNSLLKQHENLVYKYKVIEKALSIDAKHFSLLAFCLTLEYFSSCNPIFPETLIRHPDKSLHAMLTLPPTPFTS